MTKGGVHRICVFCGSSRGASSIYAEQAAALGARIASRGRVLVYGGGNIGLMGVVADAALHAGGEVIGIIPRALMDKELGHRGITDLRIVDSMHERKARMADLADAFVALPGGFGTLDEFCETLTWAQLGLHAKPCGLLNTHGYYDAFLQQLDVAVQAGFLRHAHRRLISVAEDVDDLLLMLEHAHPAPQHKWIDRDQS